jgi:5'-nucleotidase
VLILLTNDDGIHAPGLRAMEKELRTIADVCVVAPATEQSGVGHSITFLRPLVAHEVYDGPRQRGWAVEGSPADCVKLGVFEFCERKPDLVVSGINSGLNAGINVLYSGTVAAAIEGAFFGLNSVAVSLEFEEQAQFDRAATLARRVIQQILAQKGHESRLYNVNIPTAALNRSSEVRIVPMGVHPYEEEFEKRVDPRGRDYYWMNGKLKNLPQEPLTDVTALAHGYITLTPLDYDLTRREEMQQMAPWMFDVRW